MAEELKLTINPLLKLRKALNSLDAVRVVRDEREIEVTPFDFAFKVRYALAKTSGVVERECEAIEKSERGMAAEIGVYDGMPKTPENVEKAAKYNARIAEARASEITLSGILFVTLSDLLNRPSDDPKIVKTNPIPQSVINALMPIIKEEAV